MHAKLNLKLLGLCGAILITRVNAPTSFQEIPSQILTEHIMPFLPKENTPRLCIRDHEISIRSGQSWVHRKRSIEHQRDSLHIICPAKSIRFIDLFEFALYDFGQSAWHPRIELKYTPDEELEKELIGQAEKMDLDPATTPKAILLMYFVIAKPVTIPPPCCIIEHKYANDGIYCSWSDSTGADVVVPVKVFLPDGIYRVENRSLTGMRCIFCDYFRKQAFWEATHMKINTYVLNRYPSMRPLEERYIENPGAMQYRLFLKAIIEMEEGTIPRSLSEVLRECQYSSRPLIEAIKIKIIYKLFSAMHGLLQFAGVEIPSEQHYQAGYRVAVEQYQALNKMMLELFPDRKQVFTYTPPALYIGPGRINSDEQRSILSMHMPPFQIS